MVPYSAREQLRREMGEEPIVDRGNSPYLEKGDPYGFSPRNPLNKKSCGPGKCPKCGAETVKRTNHSTGSLFYGCSKFPKCKGSRNE